MTHTQQKSPNLWLVITAAASILLITIGMRMTMGMFVRQVVDSTELSIQEFSLIIAVFQLMWGLSQLLSGALADRFGAFKVLGGGALLLASACLMVPQMPTYWGLMLAIGLHFFGLVYGAVFRQIRFVRTLRLARGDGADLPCRPENRHQFLHFRRRAGLHLARHRRPHRCDYGQTVQHALSGDAVRADHVEHQIGGFLGSYIGGIVIYQFNDYG